MPLSDEIVVTGGAGAIGSAVSNSLVRQGFNVTVIDDLTSGARELLDDRVKFISGSIESESLLRSAFASKPRYVVHAAAFFANQNSVDHPERDLAVNGLGTLKVLDVARAAKVEKLVFLSSSCVYGAKESMIESDPALYPETPYAMTKLLGENYCRFWGTQHFLNTVVLRLFNTYGPGEYPGRYRNVIPNFFASALKGEPLTITGSGEETRSFVYVEDTVRAIVSALQCPTQPGEIFNICGTEEVPIRRLAESINRITGNHAGLSFLPRRSWDGVLRRKGDASKAKQKLGFEPKVLLENGLEVTYRWFIEHVQDTSHLLRVSPSSRAGGLPFGEDPR